MRTASKQVARNYWQIRNMPTLLLGEGLTRAINIAWSLKHRAIPLILRDQTRRPTAITASIQKTIHTTRIPITFEPSWAGIRLILSVERIGNNASCVQIYPEKPPNLCIMEGEKGATDFSFSSAFCLGLYTVMMLCSRSFRNSCASLIPIIERAKVTICGEAQWDINMLGTKI